MSVFDPTFAARRAVHLRRENLELHAQACQCRHCRQLGSHVPARLDAVALARLGVLGAAAGAAIAFSAAMVSAPGATIAAIAAALGLAS